MGENELITAPAGEEAPDTDLGCLTERHAVHYIVKGEKWPSLRLEAIAPFGARMRLDLTGMKVKARYRNRRGRRVLLPLAIRDARRGEVAPPSRAPAGPVDIELHWPSGEVQTVLERMQVIEAP